MSRAGAWLGVVARIGAFAGLLVAFGVVFHAAWLLLPDRLIGGTLHSAAVTALAALAAGLLLMRAVERRGPAALGLAVSRVAVRHWLLGLGIGAAALGAAAVALLVTGSLRYAAQPGSAAAWAGVVGTQLGVFVVAAFAEEVLFRGYAFQVLARSGGPAFAAVATSVLFAVAHAQNPSVGAFALINIFLAGLLLAAAYLRTLSLWFATAVHVGWNWAMASLFDLPVSGLTGFDTPLYEPAVSEPSWWSGGSFGPEGGLVGTIGFTLALLLVLRWRAVNVDRKAAAAGPLFLHTEEESNAG